jgi:hypothetical protein
MLMLACRNKADSVASLKFFVRPPPNSALDSSRRSSVMERDLSSSPSKNGNFLSEPRPLFADGRPLASAVTSPASESASSTLKQSNFGKGKKSVENFAENGRLSPPPDNISKEDDLDDLRERLATLRSYQENGGSNPKINVIQPYSPLPPPAPPQGSVQPSPMDPSPPSYPLAEPALISGEVCDTPQVEMGHSPAGPENELFFEDRRPSTPFAPIGAARGGSAGAHTLEAAARQKMDQQQQQRPAGRSIERNSKPPDLDKGFQKGTTSRRVVDFDNPRASPYEDRKMEDLIPHRKPPPPPADRSASGSWTKIQAAQAQAAQAQMRQNSAGEASKNAKAGGDKPMVQLRRPDSNGAARPLSAIGAKPDPSNGIMGGLISAGVLSAGIVGPTRIPNAPTPAQRGPMQHQRPSSSRSGISPLICTVDP